jgi:precorrin-8X/cobalt-precorrin-8 methylmutase
LANRSEIEVDLLSQLVLACGDVSLVPFVRFGKGAIAASRDALKANCAIVAGVPVVATALDQPRLRHLGCETITLIDAPYITTARDTEAEFWQQHTWKQRLSQCPKGSILVIGYAPSILLAVCQAIQQQTIQPAKESSTCR